MGKLSVYDASAGSGKTYTLVYKYLCILFTPQSSNGKPQREIFKKILAITFTNKAAWEMKSRILSTLDAFTCAVDVNSHDMLPTLVKDTGLSFEDIKKYATQILADIYADYGSFTVCTIDSFTTRLVRSFSRELRLPSSFSIVLDSTDLLSESIDMLLLKAGRDNEALTRILVDFVSEKIDEGSSWDISSILNEGGSMWNKEDNMLHMSHLSECRIENFIELKKRLTDYVKDVKDRLSEKGQQVLDILKENVDDICVLAGGKNGVASVLSKAAQGDMSLNVHNKYVKSFMEGKYTSSKVDKIQKQLVENCADEIVDLLTDIIDIKEKEGEGYDNALMILKPLKKLSVAYSIKKEMDTVKQRSNIMLLREFNEIIGNHLRSEPVPFIYEKLGERYQHYFIDEFQDTSIVQWENMKNLIYNALSGDGSAMIVGDGKQAIYRWRGGESNLFLDLCDKKTAPLPSSQVDVLRLYTNYRSSSTIVKFTNAFFKSVRDFLPKKDDSDLFENVNHLEREKFIDSINKFYDGIFRYGKMYHDGNNQKAKKDVPGYVSIQRVKGNKADERTQEYLSSTLDEIRRVVNKDGFSYSDIAVLYRRNSDGALLAEYLSSHSIPIVTTESLLIKESIMVNAVIAFMKFLSSPDDKYSRVSILNYLSREDKLMGYADYTKYYHHSLSLSAPDFINELTLHIPSLDISSLFKLPLYECAESIIEGLDMWKKGQDAYLLGLLDMVYRFSQENTATLTSFLDYWDKKKDDESISSPSSANAVKMLTVHSAKGLEYPVVIFPFASWEIKEDETIWIDVPQEDMAATVPFPMVPASIKEVSRLNPKLYEEYSSKIKLDNMNIFYVALTRASRQLHIITSESARGKSMKDLVDMFLDKNTIHHDDDIDNIYAYSRGSRGIHDYKSRHTSSDKTLGDITYTPWKNRLMVSPRWKKMWTDMDGNNPIIYGTAIHDILSMINTYNDVETAVGRAVRAGTIQEELSSSIIELIKTMIDNPVLTQYYSGEYTVLSERDIVMTDGTERRADRICIKDNEAVIIDYKTGDKKTSHHKQIEEYATLLSSMGYDVKKKILVYLGADGVECVQS